MLEGNAWHADHIIPVYAGGGMCQLDNLRTLCVPCHQVGCLRPSLLLGLSIRLENRTWAGESIFSSIVRQPIWARVDCQDPIHVAGRHKGASCREGSGQTPAESAHLGPLHCSQQPRGCCIKQSYYRQAASCAVHTRGHPSLSFAVPSFVGLQLLDNM